MTPTKSATRVGSKSEVHDHVRDLIRRHVAEKRLTLQEISRRLGKNDAYMWQYTEKGTPRDLPEEVRYQLAELFEIPEESLRPPGSSFRRGPPAQVSRGWDDIPVFCEGEEIDPSKAGEWTCRPRQLAPETEAFGVWIRGARGRLEAGDMAIVRGHQPPRVGDHVVAVANRKIFAVGRLLSLTESHASLEAGLKSPVQIDLADGRLLKVVFIQPA